MKEIIGERMHCSVLLLILYVIHYCYLERLLIVNSDGSETVDIVS